MEDNERKDVSHSCRSFEIPRRATRAQEEGKINFAKGGEQNFSTEIFWIANVIEWRHRPVYELDADCRLVLLGGIDSCPRHEKYSLQDR